MQDLSRITVPEVKLVVPVRAALLSIFLNPSCLMPPHGRADGDQCVVRRAASNVACNIMQTSSVMGSPVMDMLRDEGSRRCDDRRALLGYSSYDSDNDSEAASIKRRSLVLGCIQNFRMRIEFSYTNHALIYWRRR